MQLRLPEELNADIASNWTWCRNLSHNANLMPEHAIISNYASIRTDAFEQRRLPLNLRATISQGSADESNR